MTLNSQLQQYNQYFAGSSRARVHVFLDSVNFTQYVCDTNTDTALSDPYWRVTKCVYDSATYDNLVDVTVASPVWRVEYWEYVCLATNLATVQALTYA